MESARGESDSSVGTASGVSGSPTAIVPGPAEGAFKNPSDFATIRSEFDAINLVFISHRCPRVICLHSFKQ